MTLLNVTPHDFFTFFKNNGGFHRRFWCPFKRLTQYTANFMSAIALTILPFAIFIRFQHYY